MSRQTGIVCFVVWGLGWGAGDTFAQQAGERSKWEIEIHAGGVAAGNPTQGRVTLPAPGESFTTVNVRPSRYVSSWYFGDGAALANESAAAFTNIVRSSRITPLDPVLTGAVARTSNSGSIGFRVSRHLTPRFAAEFTLDYGRSRLQLSEAALNDIEATRISFERYWTELLASANPLQFQNKVVASDTEISNESGGQVVATGALKVRLRRDGALVPYVVAGMGGVFNRGSAPAVELRGTYSFLWTAGEPFNERDSVVVRWLRPDRTLVGLAGGGITYDLSRRYGVRAEVRLLISPNSLDTELSATPSIAVGAPGRSFASATTPSVQYSNGSAAAAAARSTLTGPAIAAFTTRESSGARIDAAITFGWFWRF